MAMPIQSVSLSGALRKFFQVIRLEKEEVSAIYFYSIVSGLIQLSLPLGIQAIVCRQFQLFLPVKKRLQMRSIQ
jgi:hypothetical protein